MIRSRRSYNLAALAESEDPNDLIHPRRFDGIGNVKPPYNFTVKINAELNQVAIALSPDDLFHQRIQNKQWEKAFKGIGINHNTYKDQIKSQEFTLFHSPIGKEKAVMIVLQFMSEFKSEVIRFGREIQVAMRVEQIKRAGLSSAGD